MKRKKFFNRKSLKITILTLFVLFLGMGLFSDYLVNTCAKNRVFENSNEIPSNKFGLLLGTSKYRIGGGINLYFKYRIDAAVELFQKGKIKYILISGDNRDPSYNEPKMIKEELLKRGIPENKILIDRMGIRTLDSMLRAKEVFKINKLTIISQRFHNERAIYIAQNHGMDVVGFDAKDVSKSYGFKTRVREFFARIKAVLDILFNVQPKSLH